MSDPIFTNEEAMEWSPCQIRILMQSAWDCGGRAADAKHDDDVALFAKAREEVRIRESNCRACSDEYGKGLHAAYRAVLDLISEDDWIRDALNDASDEASSGGAGLRERAEALLAKITQPELWHACEEEDDGRPLVCLYADDEHAGPVIWRDGMKSVALTEADAQFIAAAPQLVRDLLAALPREDTHK